jgi:hypothetical protein
MRISDLERSQLRDAVNARLESAPNLNYLLGEVIRARIDQADDPTSNLVTLLSQDLPHWLEQMEELCTRSLIALENRDAAIARVREELLQPARAMSPKPFNVRMAGFIAELAALGELTSRGYSHFVPIPTSPTLKTADYECRKENLSVCLEVKNVNSPLGIFDIFLEMLTEKRKTSSYFRSISLRLMCDDDNTATESQKAQINRFLDSIDGGPTQGMHELSLDAVKMRVEVQPGQGRVSMFRGMILGTVFNVREDKFLQKIRRTVEKEALPQLAKCQHQLRVLALNIITPDAGFPMEWNAEIRSIVDELSADSVTCEILFFHKYLEPGLAAGVSLEFSE